MTDDTGTKRKVAGLTELIDRQRAWIVDLREHRVGAGITSEEDANIETAEGHALETLRTLEGIAKARAARANTEN